VRSLLPLFAATLALAGALTAMCFVKVYGVAFLGQPRVERPPSGDASLPERLGFAWLSAGCLVLGLFPATMLHLLNQVGFSLTGHGLSPEALESNWLWLVPTHPAQASYSPLIFLLVVLGVVLVTIRLVRVFYHGRVRRADPWDCGFPEQSSRMQESADAFGQPISLVFGPLYLLKRSVPAPEDAAPKYSLQVGDRHWVWLYLPVARLTEFLSAKVGLLQRGRISIYLLYSFLTLIALLVFVR
jgi:hydrogenase-4 component B